MLSILGQRAKDLCDRRQGMSRRDVLRVGGSGMFGLTLGSMLQMKSQAEESKIGGGPGWGKAKSVVLIYLQGGPSHLDLWDPKPDAPDNVKSIFQPIDTKLPGVQFTEILPKLAQINDKFTMIRSLGYTPNGLFNHTAAIYQMMTGYTNGSIGSVGGFRRMMFEPKFGKSFGLGGSSWPDALTLSVV